MIEAIKNFLSFVEIKTKTASFIPFFTGVAYAYFINRTINVKGTVVFLIAMFLFDMAVTAINNYMDRREAGVEGHFSRSIMLVMIYSMCVPAALLGLYMTYLYGLAVLFFGCVCFAAGIGYTYGPAPISKSPYGEVVSGMIQGFCIPSLVLIINSHAGQFVRYDYLHPYIDLQVNFIEFLKLGLAIIPLICCISNIMLANNTCDMEEDAGTRYTLPMHIGKDNALKLFSIIYCIAYLAITVASILRVVPLTCLLTLPVAVIVFKNVSEFCKKQSKPETFPLSIANFVYITVPYILCIWLGAVL